MNKWAITLRYCNLKKRTPDRQLYRDRISYIESLGCRVYNIVYETTAGLHCHGVIETPNGFNMVRLRCRGWSTVCKDMFDDDGWDMYCKKDQPEEDSDDDEGATRSVIIKLQGPLWKPTEKDYKEFHDYKMTYEERPSRREAKRLHQKLKTRA